MDNLLSQQQGLILLISYGIIMTLIVYFTNKKGHDSDDFLVMNRKLGKWRGTFSIAVSWIWAPAIFIASQKSYEQGLPGIFWFTFPNILCFFTFAIIAVRARKLLPFGYSIPDYIYKRFNNDKKSHLIYLVVFFGYQLGAIIINSLAGGTLLSLLTGLSFTLSVLLMAFVALFYSLISGLRASTLTDVIQMSMILFIGFIIVPWILFKTGGLEILSIGSGGFTGNFKNIFDPNIAYSFGIASTLGLISGPIADQMFFQRSFALQQKNIVKVFVNGGLLFGIVPILLSLLGFIGAGEAIKSNLLVSDSQMIGPIIIGHYLPKWALMAFALMAFAGLSSTLDSAMCASSSLGSIDIYKKYFKKDPSSNQLIKISRYTMIIMTIIGVTIALLRPQLLWVFLIYGALASAGLFPTIFSLFWKKVTSKGVFWATLLSLVVGTPLSIYANVNGNVDYIVLSAILSVLIGFIICLIDGLTSKTDFEFKKVLNNNN